MDSEYVNHHKGKVLIYAGDGKATYIFEGRLKKETDSSLILSDASVKNDIWSSERKSNSVSVAKNKIVTVISVE